MLFTGYTLAELDSLKLAGTDELLTHTDVLVDGPYRQELQETRRNWAGSTNQQFHFLSGRYTPGVEFDPAFRPAIEFRIQTRGRIRLNGWPVPVFAARTNVTEE
jgi:anaerobic ribonucleoside-triphosphate reductase activating protein